MIHPPGTNGTVNNDAKPICSEASVIKKVKYKIIPFCLLLYIINYIDRINIGFAALEMNQDLGLTQATYGFLTSAFFIGYFFLEVPSNMLLHRFGARKWMARIIVTWGLVTMAMFYAGNSTHVLVIRILLGIAEAGFFPGMIYYFTQWFPARERAGIIGLFMLAVPFGNFLAAPISTLIIDNIHWFGHAGWRWMFMLEGGAAVVLGIMAFFYLVDSPEKASWLSGEEKTLLITKLRKEEELKQDTTKMSLKQIFMYSRIWQLGFIYMTFQIASQCAIFWMPTIVKGFSATFSNTTVGFILMVPGLISFIVMPFWGMHSDKTRERKLHTAIPMFCSVVGLSLIAFCDDFYVRCFGLILNGVGNVAYYGPFWSLPSIYLAGFASAVGVAIINSLSSLGGFLGNSIIGVIISSSYGVTGALMFMACCGLLAFSLTMCLKIKDKALEN